MAMKLSFDILGKVELPTFVLARRNGVKIGKLSNLESVRVKGSMSQPEIAFTVNKYDGTAITPYWEQIKDFKLVWCKEWDIWFEMKINSNYSDDVSKNVTLIKLGAAELSETKIYGMEINTEADILRDDYIQPTLFYNEDKPKASLIHRLLDKTPHYSVKHIDEHLKGIQRVFSFNDRKLSECFDEIAEELDILFVYDSDSNADSKPNRTISIYDLKNYCNVCGARGSFVGTCLNCGSSNITNGYGQDTTIFVNRGGLGEEITVTVNQDEVKNCFRLEAGDDLMTATIRNCNPNGTSYMWEPGTNIEDMDQELKELLWNYNKDFAYYRDEYVTSTESLPVSDYNAIIKKYEGTSEEISPTTIGVNLVGYSPIMQHYYDAIDMEVFLQSGLLPSLALQETTAVDEAAKLTAEKLSPVAIVDSKYMTLANASTAVLNAAKIAADPRYKIVVKHSSLSGDTWTGNFTVTNFSDERDNWDSAVINVTVNDDYETYVKQKLRKSLYNGTKGKYGSVAQMIDMSDSEFQAQLKKYNLVALNSINTCFTECLNILSEQGIDKEDAELYSSVYEPIYGKIGYIQSEIKIRETEIAIVRAMQNKLLKIKQNINDKLNLEKYLGDYWLDFCAYRREETYSNSNYISDYLTNKQLFDLANEFMDLADYELHKVATYTHEITSTLKNLLVIPEFRPLLDYFECGNWIRVQDDEGEIYKLRLLDYEIDFDNLQTLSVTFSEASRIIDGLSPVREILVKSSDIINNYNAAMNKTNSNFESINDSMKDVVTDTGFNNGYIYDSYYDVKDDLTQTEGKLTTDIIVVDGLIRTEITDRTKADQELSSSITQTADAIRLEVSETYETIETVEEKYTSAIETSKGYTDSQIKITNDNINLSVDSKIESNKKYFDETLDEELANYSTTVEMNSAIDISKDGILSTVEQNYSTKLELADGVASANNATDEKLKSYSTTVEMNSAIDQKADSITLSVDKKIEETVEYADTVSTEAKNDAIADATEKLKSYSTTTEMNSAIEQTANSITLSVDTQITETKEYADLVASDAESNAKSDTTEKLKSYSTTEEMNSAIDLKADSITLSVDSKISETKVYAETVADTAESNAKSDTSEKLKSYSTTQEMNAAINVSTDGILQTVSGTYSTKAELSDTASDVLETANANSDSKAAQALKDAIADTDSKLESYSTTEEMNAAISVTQTGILQTVSNTYSTRAELNTAKSDVLKTAADDATAKADAAKNNANTSTDEKLKSYSTTAEMNSAIDQKADSITLSVDKQIKETKEYADTVSSTAESNAKNDTAERLKSYSTTTEMNTAIDQKADSITLSVDKQITETKTYAETVADEAEANAKSDTTEKLKSYSTTTEMNSAIDVKANQITQSVSETYYTKSNAGTAISSLQSQITQNADSITSEVTNRTNADNDLSTRITQNADSITSEVKNRTDGDEALSSRIKQTATGIALTVTNGKTSSGIKITTTKEDGTTDETSGTIEMTGLVKFSDLSGENTTTIDGSNIKTGTIDAERIDVDNLKVKSTNIEGALLIGQMPDTVAEIEDLPKKLSELENDKNYQDYAGVVAIAEGVITADKVVGRLGDYSGIVEVGSLEADNIIVDGGVTCKNVTMNGVSLSTKLTELEQAITDAGNCMCDLDKYVLETDLTTTLSNYTKKSDMDSYVKSTTLTSTLSGYVTIADLSSMDSRVGNLENAGYVTGTTVSSTVTEMMKGYAKTSDLTTTNTNVSNLQTDVENLQNAGFITAKAVSESYVTKTSLSTTLSDYATGAQLSEQASRISAIEVNYITSSDLSSYATVDGMKQYVGSSLAGYATDSELSSVSDTANQNADEINDLNTRVTKLESAGYITSSSLSGYATAYWVNNNFVTISIANSTYATKSSLSDYATGKQLGTQASRITAVEQNVSSLSTSVSSNTTQITSLMTTIGQLQSRVSALEKNS